MTDVVAVTFVIAYATYVEPVERSVATSYEVAAPVGRDSE
tara:strand:+ start:698 stop:817 length:120 start_codon:yes stop_codon:yes gene_type:complete